jgi:hypothetical protein
MNKFLLILLLIYSSKSSAQFGYGLTVTNDIYHRYTNPPQTGSAKAYNSAGSVLLNLGVGPKIWVGGKKMSVSGEAQVVWGMFGLAIKDYKGMGTVAYPLMAKLNFNGLSGLDKEGKVGFSIGGGVQYSRTELYGLRDLYQSRNVARGLYKTYIAQVGYGFGLTGFAVAGFVRYGWNKNTDASILSIGTQWDFNANKLNKIANPESSL